MGPKGRKLKCSSCTHIWREFDPKPVDPGSIVDQPNPLTDSKPEPAAKPEPAPKPAAQAAPAGDLFESPAEPDPNEENDQGAIDDMFDTPAPEPDAPDPNEENDQGAIDDMFATPAPEPDAPDPNEENDQGAIDDMFATPAPEPDAPDPNEENDQGAIDDMFATPAAEPDAADPNEENDQGAIDDMFATPAAEPDAPDPNEENDQGAIDDMFATAEPEESVQVVDANEENDQGAIDDMFDTPLSPDKKPAKQKATAPTSKAEFEKNLPSQSAVYKNRGKPKNKSSYIYWGSLAIAASIIFGVFIIGKNTIINYFPKSAAAYELYGFETNIVGLEFVNINVRHQNQDGLDFLLVNGSIMNNSKSTKILPRIRGYLIDRNDNSIFDWPIQIAKTSLAAGEIVSFKSGMKDPAATAQKVKFQFITNKKLADN